MHVMQLLHMMKMTYTMKMTCVTKMTHMDTVQTTCCMEAIHIMKTTCTMKAHHLIHASRLRNSQLCARRQWKTLWTVISFHGSQRLYCSTCFLWVCQFSSWPDAVQCQGPHAFFLSLDQEELPAETVFNFCVCTAGCLMTGCHVLLIAFDAVSPHHRSVARCSMSLQ